MSRIIKRRRGTAIVETDKGILLTAGSQGRPFILPGGGAKGGESRFMAALRELTEETHLLPYYAEIIFMHSGKVRPTKSGKHLFQDHHTVCYVKATGHAIPGGGDAKRIAYYYSGCDIPISTTTREILTKYYEWKVKKQQINRPRIIDEEEDDNLADDEVESESSYDFDE